jgi:hypothetical protein
MMGTRWSFNFSQFARNNLNRQHHLRPRFMQLTNSTKAGISQNVAVFALAAHGLSRPALAGSATATTRADETRNDVIPGLTCGHSGEQEDTRRGMLESRQWWGVSPKNVRRNGYAPGDQVLPGVPAGGGGCPSQSQSRPEDTEEQFTVWVSPAITSQKRGANFRC